MKRTYLFRPFFWLFILAVFAACNQQPDRPRVVGEIKSVAKLATMEAKLSKIVIGTKEKKYMLGLVQPRDAAFLAHSEATVKLGIDLDKLEEDDVSIEGARISLVLPPVELVNFSYPAEKFVPDDYYSEDNSKWNRFSYAEMDDLFRQSETAIMKSIPFLGITESAEQRTRQLMTGLLKRLGFDEIYIRFKPATPLIAAP